ncbi:efflux RND transporter periplasmic adaptor subunit [Cocleimonas sp. KMM 6892]|uniref:efflux RND transporter periplasmic adaptor subunit n=1 Tax=unclassified Cocleimonas TaxID=2639732 RepID=UPI002DBDA7F6|nr:MULTISPECIES: efflux RND transporter periplasmic adaptor subunit [unclassified Cocleimonas]MEB8430832.1 efflux RND transporter periplasmic adaptor subunit [Cocleimonas sp. KMM 6892]MEC4714396.1 efflux RND transporter periplasmic adaptor subunit [Cocleimonas sp. KMM 6895]MEC4743727.1 efflux RND transporter periplasmic adaptor subunit [Cocleimonas sp. KMM 6896]
MKTLNRLLIICLAVTLAACEKPEANAAPGGMPPAQVISTVVKPMDVPVSFSYTGQVAASHEVEVRARTSGIIEKRLYEEGRFVKEGDLLFTIDRAPLNAAMAEAKAALVSAKAAKSSAQAQLKKAQRDYARVIPLANKKLLSQSDKDDAESALEIAKAAILQTEATILQAETAIKTVQISLDYTNVKASISGIAGRAMKLQGSLVQAGSDSLLTTISQTNPAYVNFGIPEPKQISQQQEISSGLLKIPASGFKVALTSSNGQQLPQTGMVSFEDYKTDPNTGNFAVRATVDNPQRLLSPGQFVRVNLLGAIRPQAIVVPQRAVLDNPQGKYVYVVGKMKGKDGNEMTVAQQRPVEVGEWVQLDGDLENGWIIKSGLNAGDEVVTEGSARIFFPGMPIMTAAAAEKPASKPSAPVKTEDATEKTPQSGGVTKNNSEANQQQADVQKQEKTTDSSNLMSSELKSELENEMQNSVDNDTKKSISNETAQMNNNKKSSEQ